MLSPKLKHLTDAQLLELLRNENFLAFEVLYDRYWEKMYYAAYRGLRDQDAAKDLIQDIFLDIWNRRSEQKINNFSSYIFSSVKFQIARYIRKGYLTQSHEDYIASIPTVNTIEEIINYNALDEQVKLSLNQLPDKCKRVFCLSRYENLSNEEIAQKLNLSRRTVEWYISNALKYLRLSINRILFLFTAFLNM